jgi:hypothetical protein
MDKKSKRKKDKTDSSSEEEKEEKTKDHKKDKTSKKQKPVIDAKKSDLDMPMAETPTIKLSSRFVPKSPPHFDFLESKTNPMTIPSFPLADTLHMPQSTNNGNGSLFSSNIEEMFKNETPSVQPNSYRKNEPPNGESMDTGERDRPLNIYLCTNHATSQDRPLRPASVVVASTEQEAYQLMEAKLKEMRYPGMNTKKYNFLEVNRFQPDVFMMTLEDIKQKRQVSNGSNILDAFVSTNHPCFGTYGAATIILANDFVQAKKMLDDKLKQKKLSTKEVFTVVPLNTTQKSAHIFYHGEVR